MAVIKTLKGQTVITVVCDIVYKDPEPDPPPDPSQDSLLYYTMQKMASAWRVVTFFLIVFVVPVVLIAIPLYARYTLYPSRTMALMAADTIDLHTMASSFWCQGQRVNVNGTFDAYLLPEAPRLNRKRRRSTVASSIMTVSEEFPEVRRMHLLKGSSFKLGVCSRWPGGTLIVVRGEENFRRCYYEEDADYDDILEKQLKDLASANEVRGTLNPKHKAIASGKIRKPGVLPPTNADVFNDHDGNGAEELAIDEGSEDPLDLLRAEKERKPNAQLPKNLREGNILADFYTENLDTKSDAPVGLADNNNVLRAARSIGLYPDVTDDSDEYRIREADAMRRLGILHTVNDTRDVSAGNSSISSSEEFMEQCKSTILYVDIRSLVDCQQQELENDPRNWHFRINETDDYFFIFMSDNSLEENVVKYYLDVERVMYNISDNTDACTNSTECVFPIKFLSSESVVVELVSQNQSTPEPISYLEQYEMQAVCQPRVAVYMVFILMVPFIILMFAFQ